MLSALLLIAVLLFSGLLLFLLTAYLMALALLKPQRMTDGRAAWILKRLSPGDLDLSYSSVNFTVRDELTGRAIRIAGWWIPCTHSRRTALIIHGYGDAKVGGIAWGPTLHSLGFNLLVIDLRAHGESEGPYSTAGVAERFDVSQIIDIVRREQPTQTKQLVLFGVSLGAAVAAGVAVMRDDIDAVILECPYADFELAARTHTRVLGGPGRWLQRLSVRWAQRLAKVRFADVRPVALILKIECPVMVIRSDGDVLVDAESAEMIQQATAARPPEKTAYWNAENAHHVEALAADPELYRQKIAEFLAPLLAKPL